MTPALQIIRDARNICLFCIAYLGVLFVLFGG